MKSLLKRLWSAALLRSLQRAGLSVVPNHFYSAVPDLADLASRQDWRRPRSMRGISMAPLDRQLELVRAWHIGPRLGAMARAARDCGHDGFGEIEADILLGFVAAIKPRRIVQIGCGLSTAVMLEAGAADIVCIDPHPTPYLVAAARRGQIRLIAKPAQLVPPEELANTDFLFIDSSHTVKPASEVNYLIHEVLPRLPAGAWVHFHDIYFPYDYARDTLDGDLFFPQETALLYAFLIGNERFRVELSLSMLHYERATELQALIPSYIPNFGCHGLRGPLGKHFPSSTWLRVGTIHDPTP